MSFDYMSENAFCSQFSMSTILEILLNRELEHDDIRWNSVILV